MVLNQQNRYSGALNLAYNASQILDFGQAHSASRLVEQKKPWSACQCAGDLDAALVNQG